MVMRPAACEDWMTAMWRGSEGGVKRRHRQVATEAAVGAVLGKRRRKVASGGGVGRRWNLLSFGGKKGNMLASLSPADEMTDEDADADEDADMRLSQHFDGGSWRSE